jgi:hypothetical protein
MPPASQTEHKGTANCALPYISNSTVVDTSKHFISGSQNILTGLRQWAERRPGFSGVVYAGFTNLVRDFVWERWVGTTPHSGLFVRMFCDIQNNKAVVLKQVLGIDPIPVVLWTSSSAEPFDFVVSNNTCYFGNGTDMKKYDSSTLSNWGILAPAQAPVITLNAGSTWNVYTGLAYCYTYFNSVTQHESSPSPTALTIGPWQRASVSIVLPASTDPQVTNIRVYRTPDGGSQDPALMQEISNSPFPNSNATRIDTTPDTSLSIRVAPEFLRNDPPPASKGFVFYGGRIWGFVNNTTYYSGFEEIANGVPEESWPSGLDGNFYPFDKEVQAHAPLTDGIAVFTAPRIYKIEGDSLDTFRRYTLLEKRGTRSRTAVTSLGGSVAWLDTSNTVWISDIGEISVPIRPDLQAINPATCYIAMHISGIYHWLVVLDGEGGKLYVYDLDTSQWMPPWTVGQSSALFSGEIGVGSIQLELALGKTTLAKLVPGSYLDNTSPYAPIIKTNLYRLTPDANPSFKGVHAWSEIKTDNQVPTQVSQMTDDDPTTAGYRDITANGEPSPDIVQGSAMLTTRWTAYDQTAQMMSMQFQWTTVNQNFHLYQMDESFYPFGG